MLDGDYRGRGVCSACLVGMALERLHRGWRRSEVELAMGKVFKAPAPLSDMPTGPCGDPMGPKVVGQPVSVTTPARKPSVSMSTMTFLVRIPFSFARQTGGSQSLGKLVSCREVSISYPVSEGRASPP